MTDSEKLDLLLEKFGGMEKRMDSIEKHMDSMEKRMDVMEKRMDVMEKRMDVMEKRMDSMETDIASIKLDIKEMHVEIESDLTHRIGLIADGHAMLTDKIDSAVKPYSVMELMQLKISILEEKVRKLEMKESA